MSNLLITKKPDYLRQLFHVFKKINFMHIRFFYDYKDLLILFNSFQFKKEGSIIQRILLIEIF
jgi:hypothetical protein